MTKVRAKPSTQSSLATRRTVVQAKVNFFRSFPLSYCLHAFLSACKLTTKMGAVTDSRLQLLRKVPPEGLRAPSCRGGPLAGTSGRTLSPVTATVSGHEVHAARFAVSRLAHSTRACNGNQDKGQGSEALSLCRGPRAPPGAGRQTCGGGGMEAKFLIWCSEMSWLAAFLGSYCWGCADSVGLQ